MGCSAKQRGCVGVAWCGLCYAGVRGRAWYPGHRGVGRSYYHARSKGTCSMKRKRSDDGALRGGAAVDGKWLSTWPMLHEHLTATAWEEDDSPRLTSTLLLFSEEGCFKACLNDRAEGRSCFVSADDIETLWEALENGLVHDALEWRSKKASPPTVRKKP